MRQPRFAPVQIEYMWLVDSAFHLESTPSENMEIGLEVFFDKLEHRRDDDNTAHEKLIVSIPVNLHDADDESDVRFSALARIEIGVMTSSAEGVSDDQVESYLTTNAVSMAYSHARSCFMTLSALSPMGVLMIPAIMPQDLVREAEEDDVTP